MSIYIRVIGFLFIFVVANNLYAEEPEQALDRITDEVIQESGFPDATLIDQRFLEWLATAILAPASGDMTDSGVCGVSSAACELPTDNQNLDFPGVRDISVSTRRDGQVNSSFKVRWRRPERLPRDLRRDYELVAYDVYLTREDGTFERFRLEQRLNRNGKLRPPRKIKFRRRIEAEYTVSVRAIYDLKEQTNAAVAAPIKAGVVSTSSDNTRIGSSGFGSGWGGLGGIKPGGSTLVDVGDLANATNPSVDANLLGCIQSIYPNNYLLADLNALNCIQEDISDIAGLEHLPELRSLFLGNVDSTLSTANSFTDISVLAGLAELYYVSFSGNTHISLQSDSFPAIGTVALQNTLGGVGTHAMPNLSGSIINRLYMGSNNINSFGFGNPLPSDLDSLFLDHNLLDSGDLSAINTDLFELDLSHNGITLTSTLSSAVKTSVDYLSFDSNPLTSVPNFSDLTGLCSLSATDTTITSLLANQLPSEMLLFNFSDNSNLTAISGLHASSGYAGHYLGYLTDSEVMSCPDLQLAIANHRDTSTTCGTLQIPNQPFFLIHSQCMPAPSNVTLSSGAGVFSEVPFTLSWAQGFNDFNIGTVTLQECNSTSCAFESNWHDLPANEQPQSVTETSMELIREADTTVTNQYAYRIKACSSAGNVNTGGLGGGGQTPPQNPQCATSSTRLDINVTELESVTELVHIWTNQEQRQFKLAWRLPSSFPGGSQPDYFRIHPGLSQPSNIPIVLYNNATGTRLWQSSVIDADDFLGAVYTVESCTGNPADGYCSSAEAINLQTSTPGNDLSSIDNLNYSWTSPAQDNFNLAWQYDQDYMCNDSTPGTSGRPAFFQIAEAVTNNEVDRRNVPANGCSSIWSTTLPDTAMGSSYVVRACKSNNDCGAESVVTLLGGAIDTSLPVPQWATTSINVDQDSRQFMLSWTVIDASGVDYYKVMENGPFADTVFYTEETSMPLQRYRGGNYSFRVSACRRDRENGDSCGNMNPVSRTAMVTETTFTMNNVVKMAPDGWWFIGDPDNGIIQLGWHYANNCAGYPSESTRPDFYRLQYDGLAAFDFVAGRDEMLDASNGDGDCTWLSPEIRLSEFHPNIIGDDETYTWEIKACKNNGVCGNTTSITLSDGSTSSTAPITQDEALQTNYWDQGGPTPPENLTPGGPDDLKPGVWWDPERDGTGWSFYWASDLRYPSLHEQFGETYDLIAVWYSYAEFPNADGNLQWSPVWMFAQLKLAGDEADQYYEGTLFYPNQVANGNATKPCDMEGHCAVGTLRLIYDDPTQPGGLENTTAIADVTINREGGLAGITSADFNLEYISNDPELSGGSDCTLIENSHDHYNGVWLPRDPVSNVLDESFAVQTWLESWIDGSLITFYDDNGHPIWGQAVHDGRPDMDGCGSAGEVGTINSDWYQDENIRITEVGFNPTLHTPPGYDIEMQNQLVGTFGRIYDGVRGSDFSDLRAAGFYIDIDPQVVSNRSIQLNKGSSSQPVYVQKAANFHDVRYYVGDSEIENQSECEMDRSSGPSACNLRLNWFTDAENPNISVFLRNDATGQYTRVACAGSEPGCDANLYPAVVDYDYAVNTQGTYQLELWKYPDQVVGTGLNEPNAAVEGNALMAQSSLFAVVDNIIDGDAAAGLEPADLTAGGVLQTHPTHNANVGMLAGEGGTTGGAATYTIPINVPPGRAGMQPGVSLSYNSRSGNGTPGMGWSLSAGSAITRCPSTAAQDGFTVGITFTDTDRLCLDGQRLVRVNAGDYWSENGEYRTEIDSFSRITMQADISGDNVANNNLEFKVEQANGMVDFYGATVASRAKTHNGAASRVSSWLMSRMQDRSGNSVHYLYQQQGETSDSTANVQNLSLGQGETILTAIAYTGTGTALGNRRVEFNYASRCDASNQCDNYESYVRGYRTEQTLRLSNIKTCVSDSAASVCQSGEFVRDYELTPGISDATGRLLLNAVTESAWDGNAWISLPETVFAWGQTQPSYSFDTIELNSNQPIIGDDDFNANVWSTSEDKRAPNITTIGDIDGNGSRELLVGIDGNQYLIGVDAEGNELGRMRLSAILADAVSQSGDFNNDGRTDFLAASLNTANSTYEFFVMQWKQQTLWSDCGAGCTAQNLFDARSTGVTAPTATNNDGTVFLLTAPVVADFDGDSRNDILLRMIDTSGDVLFRIHQELTTTRAAVGNTSSMALTTTDIVIPQYLQSLFNLQPQIADFDGDGRADILVQAQISLVPERSGVIGVLYNNSTLGSFSASSFEFQAMSAIGPTGQPVNTGMAFDPSLTYYLQQDINGDGLQDLLFVPAGTIAGFSDNDSQLSWHYQMNTGDRSSNAALFATPVDTDSVIGLWRTQSTNGAVQPVYASLMQTMDWNNDGRPELAVPVKLNNIVCINRVVSENLTQLLCPAHPDLTDSELIPINAPGGCDDIDNGFQECELYASGTVVPDASLYQMSILEFNYDQGNQKYNVVEVPYSETGLLSSVTLNAGDDLFGDGVSDTYGPAGCVELNSATLACTDIGTGFYSTATAALLDGKLAGVPGATQGLSRNYYRNQQLQSNTDTLDLLLDVMDGFGKTTSWDYAPLSSNASRPTELPLYSIPDRDSGNSLFDIAPEDHFYFSSSMYVVSAMYTPNGIGADFNTNYYGYEEAVYNNKGRGFTGFRVVHTISDVSDDNNDLWNTNGFHQVFPLIGRLHTNTSRTAVELVSPQINPIGETQITWNGNVTTHNDVYFPQALSEVTSSYDLSTRSLMNTHTVNGRVYDQYGNMTTQTSTSTDENLLTTVETVSSTFDLDAGDETNWWINRLTRNITTSNVTYAGIQPPANANSPLNKTVTAVYTWNAIHRKPACAYTIGASFTGDISALSCSAGSAINSFADNATRAVTTYDSYGNPRNVYVLGSGMAAALERHTQSVFGGDGYFATQLINAEEYSTSLVYDSSEGQVLETQDANNLRTYMAYDAFGRETQTWYPTADDVGFETVASHYAPRTSTAYAYGGSGNEYYLMTRTTDGAPIQTQYLDILSRPLRSVTGGYLGNDIGSDDNVTTTVSYNRRGQMLSQREPVFANTGSLTSYVYDALGRVTRKTEPATISTGNTSTRTTHYEYLGLTTRIWTGFAATLPNVACDTTAGDISTLNDNVTICLERTQASNEWLLSTHDAHGESTRYWYDAQGNPIAMTDPAGNVIASEFNGLGQRTRIDDPNQGISTFIVNGLGEVTSQTNARNQTFTMSYDHIGRMTSRNVTQTGQPTLSDSWLYDFGVGNGLLAETARAQDNIQIWRREFTYDINFRPRDQIITFDGDGDTFTTTIYSDPYFVRPYARTYPNNGLAVYSQYDQNGYLTEEGTAEQASSSNDYLYRMENISPRGQREEITYGNGMTQRWAHHASTGQMQQTWVDPVNSADLITHIEYRYDRFGNVVSQGEVEQGITETFSYDYLHRLTQSSRSGLIGADNINYGYNKLGNLTSKSDFSSSYSYGGTGPSCSGVASAGPNAVTTAGGVNYSYDASGNLICDSAGSQMSYDPFNQATSIMKDGSLATFAYDSANQRYRQGGAEDIIYIDKMYERHGQNKHQYYVGDYAVITNEGAGREISYLHADRLGSMIAISAEDGSVNTNEQRGFDPFGKPREGNWSDSNAMDGTASGDLNGYEQTNRGYTGHEHLNGTNLIHMNGRVYDYNLGRFMSVDPVVQFANNGQSFNAYSYIMNNPMSGTDPSGYTQESTCGSSNSGGCGGASVDTSGDSTETTIDVTVESTGSRIARKVGTLTSSGNGTATYNDSFTGKSQQFAFSSGASSGNTSNAMGSGEGTGAPEVLASNSGGKAPSMMTQENGVSGCRPPLECAGNSHLGQTGTDDAPLWSLSTEDRQVLLRKRIQELVNGGVIQRHKIFKTPEKAAIYILEIVAPLSREYELEVGGSIVAHVGRGEGFKYTVPEVGEYGKVLIRTDITGYHTHPTANTRFSNDASSFSGGNDARWVKSGGNSLYVGARRDDGSVGISVCEAGNCSLDQEGGAVGRVIK